MHKLLENYAISSSEVILENLQSRIAEGLSSEEVLQRQRHYGLNLLPIATGPSVIAIFFRQFKAAIIWIMITAAFLSFIFDHPLDSIVIVVIIIANILIGFFHEFRAEKAISKLQNLLVTKVKVKRDGAVNLVTPAELVPGDIIMLEAGDKVPADSRLLTTKNLQINESTLTGESFPVNKTSKMLHAAEFVSDQINMAFMGTLVERGSGQAIVVTTGGHTQLGKIAKNLQTIEETESHYHKQTKKLSSQMVMVALFSAATTFTVGFFIRDFDLYEMIIFTIATLVSALPESLPIILMLVLAVGAQRMAKRNAIVRKLAATETLGVVSVILTDKTGTLTRNEMRAAQIIFPNQDSISAEKKIDFSSNSVLKKLLTITAYCNNITESFGNKQVKNVISEKVAGDPTEKAVLQLSIDSGLLEKISKEQIEKIDDLPFIQEQRMRATLVRFPQDKTETKEIFVLGAPENILQHTKQYLTKDGVRIWSQEKLNKITTKIHEISNQGMRVIACAYIPCSPLQMKVTKSDLRSMVFVGCVGIADPPRPEVAAAIEKAKLAGIRVIMATGDHPKTAVAIAKQIGLVTENSSEDCALTEKEVLELTDNELVQELRTKSVLARLSPTSKLRLAKLLQKEGEIVAMTGDGVNDAPALKQADVGISMGKKGTDVAREASKIVLADDNFSSIISAIEEGRVQFSNVRRTSYFLIATNVAESISLLIALLLGFPLPLLPLQILWLNIVTGGVTDIALTTEKAHVHIMRVSPRKPNEPILVTNFLPLFSTIIITMVITLITVFIFFLPESLEKARTAAFTVLSLTQLFNMFTMRSLHESVFQIGAFSNKVVNIVFCVSFLLVLVVLYIPFLQRTFEFVPLSLIEFLGIFATSFLVFLASESIKKLKPAGTNYKV